MMCLRFFPRAASYEFPNVAVFLAKEKRKTNSSRKLHIRFFTPRMYSSCS